jgi:hypothetical protein
MVPLGEMFGYATSLRSNFSLDMALVPLVSVFQSVDSKSFLTRIKADKS